VTKVIAALSAASDHFATLWSGHEIAAPHETGQRITMRQEIDSAEGLTGQNRSDLQH